MNIVFGGYGTDAGYWYIDEDGNLHHVGGWAPDAVTELVRTVGILGEAIQLKTPKLGEAVIKSTLQFVKKEIAEHLKPGDVLVLK